MDSTIAFHNNQNIKFVDPELPGCFNIKAYSVLANTTTLGKYASDYTITVNHTNICSNGESKP